MFWNRNRIQDYKAPKPIKLHHLGAAFVTATIGTSIFMGDDHDKAAPITDHFDTSIRCSLHDTYSIAKRINVGQETRYYSAALNAPNRSLTARHNQLLASAEIWADDIENNSLHVQLKAPQNGITVIKTDFNARSCTITQDNVTTSYPLDILRITP